MKSILVMNGPNLNLLGQREPGLYGHTTLADVETLCHQAGDKHGVAIEFMQSNHEGVLIDTLHDAGKRVAAGEMIGVVFNAGAFTHTSVALQDAIKGAQVPVIEIHISNVHAREAFRNHSYLSSVATGIVVGFGVKGYALAIDGLVMKHGEETQ
ncbi:type II 3-dehydroquinate dehydratase [Enterovibrio sp. ZSDZ42]|uniref:3-dehydroquinate dehydratase n=1 Tax=Enterovibrio gelatinilyticus TaxID=2899819 RepID=A0ABT5R3Z1_9GAMM|nr:type II 3-dehydroquinate dehydratase [Enterovibrio sp. ZSDZ42]MDD1794991.1 type II 3-dehydroquinate dehydratase [Enterovibrio sp. ZSDZ42]